MSVYNLSRANLARPDEQLDAVYGASLHFLTTLVPDNFDRAKCSFALHGDRSLLPDKYVAAARDLESTMTGDDFRINLLAAYDANDELHTAYSKAQRDQSDICDAFEIGNVDLVIRTTPEPLLSGFLPFQTQYAQLLFLTTPLNDLDARDIDQAIADYRRLPQLHGR